MARSFIPLSLRVGETQQIGWWRFTLSLEQDEECPQLRNFIVALAYRHDPFRRQYRFVADLNAPDAWALYYDDVGSGYAGPIVIASESSVVIADPQLAINMARQMYRDRRTAAASA